MIWPSVCEWRAPWLSTLCWCWERHLPASRKCFQFPLPRHGLTSHCREDTTARLVEKFPKKVQGSGIEDSSAVEILKFISLGRISWLFLSIRYCRLPIHLADQEVGRRRSSRTLGMRVRSPSHSAAYRSTCTGSSRKDHLRATLLRREIDV